MRGGVAQRTRRGWIVPLAGLKSLNRQSNQMIHRSASGLDYGQNRLTRNIGHDSDHEFIKHWHRERGITVRRAPNHAFGYQL